MAQHRTRYRSTVVSAPDTKPQSGLYVLKPAKGNKKLGAGGSVVQKGRYRGMPMFSLTLEERATCWDGCANLEICYGDNMPFAKRYQPGVELEAAIEKDIVILSRRHPQGFVVRLHVLGDFYSVAYTQHWRHLVDSYPRLHLFGYTHWPWDSPIGHAVTQLVQDHADRVAFRRSDKDDLRDPLPGAITIPRGAPAAQGTVICPEQTGKTASCTTCGLCMNSVVGVSFIDHSKMRLPVVTRAA